MANDFVLVIPSLPNRRSAGARAEDKLPSLPAGVRHDA